MPLTLVRGHTVPPSIGITQMAGHGEADISHVFGHIVSNPFPALRVGTVLPVEPIHTAMVLVIPALRVCGMDNGIVWIMAIFVFRAVFF
jgi:hypothetical protein